MNVLQEHISAIEGKIGLLLSKLKAARKENEKLKKELEEKSNDLEQYKQKLQQLTLKLELSDIQQNTASNTSKASLEKRINDYIKEIDKCIALLGDQD